MSQERRRRVGSWCSVPYTLCRSRFKGKDIFPIFQCRCIYFVAHQTSRVTLGVSRSEGLWLIKMKLFVYLCVRLVKGIHYIQRAVYIYLCMHLVQGIHLYTNSYVFVTVAVSNCPRFWTARVCVACVRFHVLLLSETEFRWRLPVVLRIHILSTFVETCIWRAAGRCCRNSVLDRSRHGNEHKLHILGWD